MRTTLVRTKPILRAAVASLAVLATVGFASPTDIQAQQGQIIGTVTNATTGGPISEVQVFIEGQNPVVQPGARQQQHRGKRSVAFRQVNVGSERHAVPHREHRLFDGARGRRDGPSSR